MRTTIRLDDELLIAAKLEAARTGRTLTQVFQDALRMWLARPSGNGTRVGRTLPAFGGNGLQPGVDLDDSASLLDLMEGRS